MSWRSAAVLPGFAESLAQATTQPYELVVVDNASPDGAPPLPSGARLVESSRNLGYGGGCNLGAAGFEGDVLVVANSDVEWSPGSLDRLLEAFERWPRAGCVGPAIRTTDGLLYPSARAFPSLGRGLGHALFGWWWPANPWTRAYRAEEGSPVEGPTGWLSGSLMAFRREAWEQVGGFDPKYFMYCEDMDLCRRLAVAGWQNVYVPSAVITHIGGHATRQASSTMLREHHRALYTYLSEHYRSWRHAPLRLGLAAGLWLRYLLAARFRSLGEGAAPTRSADLLEKP